MVVFIVLIAFGCNDVLDKVPLDSISADSFWRSEADLRLAVNELYSQLSRQTDMDIQTIDYFSGGSNPVSAGSHAIPNSDNNWNNRYTAIRRIHDILENINLVPEDQGVRDRYEAEARFFRGYFYFELVKRFGDVPLVTSTLDVNSEELYGPRTNREEVVDFIISDLQFSADKLPRRSGLESSDEGRITRGSALGFLSRVALYEGTREKYHSYGNANKHLQIAMDAALELINDPDDYALFSGFAEIFEKSNENNSEVMLSKFYKEGITGVSPRGRGLVVDANMHPTKYLADAFLCTDGLPIEHSPLFQGYGTIDSEFINRDPRMEGTIWKPGSDYDGAPLTPDLSRARTGYWPKKPGDPLALVETFIYTDDIYMRFAEVLLNFAEATFELNGSITDEELNISINKLRARAGMPVLTNSFVDGANPAGVKLNMLDEIRRERRIELAGESFRYDDLMRWKMAEYELPRAILGAQFQQSSYPDLTPGVDINVDENGFIVSEAIEGRQFEDPKHYLFPLPAEEISLNENLEQNPWW